MVAIAAGGFTVGAFLGYKIATRVGFTFEAHLGARYVVIEPAIRGASGASLDGVNTWLPLLQLNIGWSFQKRRRSYALRNRVRWGVDWVHASL